MKCGASRDTVRTGPVRMAPRSARSVGTSGMWALFEPNAQATFQLGSQLPSPWCSRCLSYHILCELGTTLLSCYTCGLCGWALTGGSQLPGLRGAIALLVQTGTTLLNCYRVKRDHLVWTLPARASPDPNRCLPRKGHP